jgi:hypothetical protein
MSRRSSAGAARIQKTPQAELLNQEQGFRKWRVRRGADVFYVVICRPWDDHVARWYISPNGARWAEVSRDDLRSYLDASS